MSIMDKKGKLPSTHDDDLSNNKEHIGRIRVGKDYQVIVPSWSPPNENLEDYPDKALIVWTPSQTISDIKLANYLLAAKDKFRYNEEQALGMLFWHKHDLKNAITDLANFTPSPEEWSYDDKIHFEHAFQFYGKNFFGIRTMFPGKTVSQLIKFYYLWKKSRTGLSLIDKYQKSAESLKKSNDNSKRKLGIDEDIEDISDNKSIMNGGRERRAPVAITRRTESQGEGFCSNCHVYCTYCHPTSKGKMCASCKTHFKNTGNLRPTLANDTNTLSVLKLRKNPPKGMYLNHDDIVLLSNDVQANVIIAEITRNVIACKRIMQANKQSVSFYSKEFKKYDKITKILDDFAPANNSAWTKDDIALVSRGIEIYGEDYKTIAEIIGNKSEAQVRLFSTKFDKIQTIIDANDDTLIAENDPGNSLPESSKDD